MRLVDLRLDGRDALPAGPVEGLGDGVTVLLSDGRAEPLAAVRALLLRTLRPDGTPQSGTIRVTGEVLLDDDLGRAWQVRTLADGRVTARAVQTDGTAARWVDVTGSSAGGDGTLSSGPQGRVQLRPLAALPSLDDGTAAMARAADDELLAVRAAAQQALAALTDEDREQLDAVGASPADREELVLAAAALLTSAADERTATAEARAARSERDLRRAQLVSGRLRVSLLEQSLRELEPAPTASEPEPEPAPVPTPVPVAMDAQPPSSSQSAPEALALLPRWLGWVVLLSGGLLTTLTVQSVLGDGVPVWVLPVVAVVLALAVGFVVGRALGHGRQAQQQGAHEHVAAARLDEYVQRFATVEAVLEDAPGTHDRADVPAVTAPTAEQLAVDEELAAAREHVERIERVTVFADEPVAAADAVAATAGARRAAARDRWWAACGAAGVDPHAAPAQALATHAKLVAAALAVEAADAAEQEHAAFLEELAARRAGVEARPLLVDAVVGELPLDSEQLTTAARVAGDLARTRQVLVLTDRRAVASALLEHAPSARLVELASARVVDLTTGHRQPMEA